MFGVGHSIAGLDIAGGPLVLMLFSAGAAVVVAAVLARVALRRVGFESSAGTFWIAALALAGGVAAYIALDSGSGRDQSMDRRTIEARAGELTARALAPGSPLGCLDAVDNALVENACERSLFANAEAVAAAVAYVDARVSLLAGSAALAQRDQTYRPTYERLRRGLEADRYGVVAHVLTTRGCTVADCPEIKLLADPSRVLANIKARTFDAALGSHASNWPNGGGNAALALVTPAAPAPPALPTAPAPLPAATTGIGGPMAAAPASPPIAAHPAPVPGKFDFPSASSIPPVSIMSAEPSLPSRSEAKSAARVAPPVATPPAAAPPEGPMPSKRQAAAAAASRRAASREAPALAAPPPAFAPPQQAQPQPPASFAPPEPPAEAEGTDTHAAR